MSVTHHSIEFAGEAVGHAISLGTRYAFYTTHPRLKRFNSRRFDSLEDIRAAVADGLRPRVPSTPLSTPLWHPEQLLTEDEITDLMNDQTFNDDPRAIKGR